MDAGRGQKAGQHKARTATSVEPEAVRAELDRILDSADFDASERNRRFLRYVVEQTLAGRGNRIKAYDIAVTVFGRDESFDPQSDPIVRIEASRLRRSLERFYLLASGQGTVRIAVPKGGYVPAFHPHGQDGDGKEAHSPAAFHRHDDLLEESSADHVPVPQLRPQPDPPASVAPEVRALPRPILEWPSRGGRNPWSAVLLVTTLLGAITLGWFAANLGERMSGEATSSLGGAAPAAALRQGPAILVAPFDDDGSTPPHADLSHGFTRELIAGLTRFKELFVFGPQTAFRHGGQSDLRDIVADLDVDYIVSGGLNVSTDHFQVTASLIDAKSGLYLWSGKFDGRLEAAQVIKVRNELAEQVVQELAQPYGVIFTEKTLELQGKPPESFTSYECLLRFYQYWRAFDAELFASTRDCLEVAIATDRQYADAFSSLALIYIDAYRFSFDRADGAELLAKSLRMAQRAVELAPYSSRSYHALHLAYWLTNDVERSFEVAERGLALNPNDAELMADLGLRYTLRARWDEGLSLVNRALARNPARTSPYRLALFLHNYVSGRYEEALAEAEKIDVPDVIYSHLALAMAHAALGQVTAADRDVDQILKIDPAYGARVIADLHKRNVHPDLIRLIVDGLRKAGLAVNGSLTRQDS